MNASMLSEDDLTRLLGEAAQAYQVPAQGPGSVLEGHEDVPSAKAWPRRRGVQLTAAAAVVALAAVLAQGSGGGPSLKQDSTAAGAQRSSGDANGPAGGFASGGGTGGGTGGGAGGGTGGGVGAAPMPLGAMPPAVSGSEAASTAATLQFGTSELSSAAEARVVKTGGLSLVVDDGKVTVTVTKVTAVARSARGYISDSTSQEFGDSPSASVTMRVPVDSFEAVIGQIRALKAEVVSQETSGQDVTATYADTEAQITSLKAARVRFLTILAGARTIGETLTVQQRVDDVQGRIDRLEGQRRVLENQSELATLTVTVGEKADAILETSEQSGFAKAWADAKDGFTSGVEALIARSGRTLLVLIVATVGFFVARLGWRLARRRLV